MSTYGFLIYLMTEKESMEQTKKLLAEEGDPRERKKLKELAEWHYQNYMQFLKRPPEWIPWCVKQYLLGYREERPSWNEIQQEYSKRREFFARKAAKRERLYRVIAFSFALLAILYILFKLR
jgi:hypothetical protein